MTDFYSVLMNSLNRRDLQDPAARERVFVHARMAMIRRLWSFEPPLSNEDIEEKIGLFDAAVQRIDSEIGVEPVRVESMALVAAGASASYPVAPPAPAEDDPWDDEQAMPEVAAPQLAQSEGAIVQGGEPAAEAWPAWDADGRDLDLPAAPPSGTVPPAGESSAAFDRTPTPPGPAAGSLDPPVPLPPARARGREPAGWGDEAPAGRWNAPAQPGPGRRSGAATARALIERGIAWRPGRTAAAEPAAAKPAAPVVKPAAPAVKPAAAKTAIAAPRPPAPVKPAAPSSDRPGGRLLARFARRRDNDDPTRHLIGRIRPPRAAPSARNAAAEPAQFDETGPLEANPAAAPEPAPPPRGTPPRPEPEADEAWAAVDEPSPVPTGWQAPAEDGNPAAAEWRAGEPAAVDADWDASDDISHADAAWDDAEAAPAGGTDPAGYDDGDADDGFGPPPVGQPAPAIRAGLAAEPLRAVRQSEPWDIDAEALDDRDGGEAEAERPARRRALPVGRMLAAAIVLLAIVVVGWSAYLLYPLFFGSAQPDREVAAAGGLADAAAPADQPAGPRGPAADVAETIVLFNGLNPTIFQSSPDNPVRFDGDTATGHIRIASSAGSAGARAVVGPGIADRVAGRTVRITVMARSSADQGAETIRFAYLSGTTISPWKTALLDDSYSALDLSWQVPARSGDGNDYIIIEPGVPGEGTGADIQEIRIEVLKD